MRILMSDNLHSPIEAALVILVPEIEPLVAPFRLKYDPSAALGVPAHITINYPFSPEIDPDENLHRELHELFAKTDPFEFTLSHFARFTNVLYLAPDPDAPIKNLIKLVTTRFPESPPYSGNFNEIIPHLTIAQVEDEEVLNSVERELTVKSRGILPITVRAKDVCLLANSIDRWRKIGSYLLGLNIVEAPK